MASFIGLVFLLRTHHALILFIGMLPSVVRSMYNFLFSLKSYLTEKKVWSPKQPGRDSHTPMLWLTQTVVLYIGALKVYLSSSLFCSDFPATLLFFGDRQYGLHVGFTVVDCAGELDGGNTFRIRRESVGRTDIKEVVCKYHNSTELFQRVVRWWPLEFALHKCFLNERLHGTVTCPYLHQ